MQTLPLITEELARSAVHESESAPAPTGQGASAPLPPASKRAPAHEGASGGRTVHPPSAGTRLPERAGTQVLDSGSAQSHSKSIGVERGDDKSAEKDTKAGGISATQLLAGAGAAATSSVVGGQLGVAGTVVGAGVASIITALAVTFYSRSLDKGKEKIKEVSVKLVKPEGEKTQATPRATRTHSFPAGAGIGPSHTSDSADAGARGTESRRSESDEEPQPKSWLQKLRRKRVLYPAAIGAATFVIGIGAVVLAESFTEADISPGTSQISRSVSGGSSVSGDSSDSGDTGGGSGLPAGGTGQQGTGNQEGTSGEGSSADDGSGTGTGAEDAGTGQTSDQDGSSNSGADGSGGGSDSQDGTGSQGGSGSQGDSGTQGDSGSQRGSGSQGGTGSGGTGSGGTGSGSSGSDGG